MKRLFEVSKKFKLPGFVYVTDRTMLLHIVDKIHQEIGVHWDNSYPYVLAKYFLSNQYDMWVNECYSISNEVILIAERIINGPQFTVIGPVCSCLKLNDVVDDLSEISMFDVDIIGIGEMYSSMFTSSGVFYEKSKEVDYIVDIGSVSRCFGREFKNLRKRVNKCRRNYDIEFIEFGPELIPEILQLYDVWEKLKEDKIMSYIMNTRWEKSLLNELRRSPISEFIGVCVKIGGKIVAVDLNYIRGDECIGVISKADTRYENVHYLIQYEMAQRLDELGVKKENFGPAMNGLIQAKLHFRPTRVAQVILRKSDPKKFKPTLSYSMKVNLGVPVELQTARSSLYCIARRKIAGQERILPKSANDVHVLRLDNVTRKDAEQEVFDAGYSPLYNVFFRKDELSKAQEVVDKLKFDFDLEKEIKNSDEKFQKM